MNVSARHHEGEWRSKSHRKTNNAQANHEKSKQKSQPSPRERVDEGRRESERLYKKNMEMEERNQSSAIVHHKKIPLGDNPLRKKTERSWPGLLLLFLWSFPEQSTKDNRFVGKLNKSVFMVSKSLESHTWTQLPYFTYLPRYKRRREFLH